MGWEQVKVELKGASFPLPGGGSVEITDDTDVSMGDGFTFRQLTYRDDTTEIVFEVRDGAPGAVSLKLDGAGFIRQKDLTAIRLDHIRAEVYAVAGVGAFIPDGGDDYGQTDYVLNAEKAREAVKTAASRRRITPEFLHRVAEIHQSAPKGERLAAVKAAFSVKERQALRYIAQAREKDLIDGDT